MFQSHRKPLPLRRFIGWLLIGISLSVPALAGRPLRVGERVVHRSETDHPYRGGGVVPQRVRSEEIHFSGATYIAPHFARFELAPGDFVIVRSPDGAQSWRYEGLGRAGLGRRGGFYSVRIRGDRAVVELWAKQGELAYGYAIDHFARGYGRQDLEELWAEGRGEELHLPPLGDPSPAICTADDKENAICYESSEPEIYDRARAVARLFIQGTDLCTGWLLGDEGHLVTNQHCIGDQVVAGNTDYEFLAEGATCEETCGTLGCDGTVEAFAGVFVQASVDLDYALIELSSATDLPATYGFLQFRETEPLVGERIYIPQHPGGRGKEIAVFSTYPEDADGFPTIVSLDEPGCNVALPEVGYWADTEGGSSGSPVLATADHRVVALHHCAGPNDCATGGSGDDPNLGIPALSIIADLGENLPNNAIAGEIFADGFETGDVSAWSQVVP